MLSKPLPYDTLCAIPRHSPAHSAAYHESKPRALRIWRDLERVGTRRHPPSFHSRSGVFATLPDAILGLKALRTAHRIRDHATLGGSQVYFELIVGTSRLRPFARRRFSTARPAFVLIRARNPWVRFLRMRLG